MQINGLKKYLTPNTTFAAQAAIIHIFLKIISPDSKWTLRLHELLTLHKFINPKKMGFLEKWEADEFWGINCHSEKVT